MIWLLKKFDSKILTVLLKWDEYILEYDVKIKKDFQL
jgi:hypothetical protein